MQPQFYQCRDNFILKLLICFFLEFLVPELSFLLWLEDPKPISCVGDFGAWLANGILSSDLSKYLNCLHQFITLRSYGIHRMNRGCNTSSRNKRLPIGYVPQWEGMEQLFTYAQSL
jgi:hypothetical protein